MSSSGGGGGGAQNQGRHRNSPAGSSVSAFLSTLIPVFLGASILFLLFLFLRKRLARVYHPRTFIGSLKDWQKSPEQTKGFLGWRQEYSRLKDEFVMGHASLDNYLWIRFMRMLAAMCLVGCIITWPILFPVNATGDGDEDGLDILSFSNVTPGARYYAQVFVSWLFMAWVMFLITRESRFLIRLQQHYYLSPTQSSLISSRTILFTNVPEEARSEQYLRERFEGVKKVWFMNVPDDLAQMVEDRDNAGGKLEQGEIKLIQNYVKRQRKLEKKGKASPAKQDGAENHLEISQKDRPTHRLPKLKFLPIGKKVDTVDWARGELQHLIPEVARAQTGLKDGSEELQSACFVEFVTVEAAHKSRHSCGMKNKVALTPKEYAPSPDTVIWKNITKPFWMYQAFNLACTAFVVFLCLFWSIPVAVIGAISNINYLEEEVPFLSFISFIPDVVLGVVTGLLPVILLAVLMSLVPIVCNILAKLYEPTMGAVQMKVQAWYFPFQVIQVFLITTFSSGAASVAAQIVKSPSLAVTLLAKNLPKASNFYISYFILFGLLSSAIQLLNIVALLFFLFLGKILDKTPRKMYNRYVNLAGLGWGSLYAKFANMGVIALSYSTIAPLVLGFAFLGFTFLYMAFRYNVLFTLGTQVSTRGASYGRALHQMITGIYLSELCLIGLLAIGSASSVQSVGPLVLEVLFLIATVIWHIWLSRSLAKLDADIPERPEISPRNGHVQNGDLEKAASDGVDRNVLPDHQTKTKTLTGPEHRSGIMARVKGFLHPDSSAYNASFLVSSCLDNHQAQYSDKEVDEAYVHPAAVSECPQIWIAKDKYGLSKQEIAATTKHIGEGVEMTDEAAWIDDKGKLHWSEDIRSAPIYEEPVAW